MALIEWRDEFRIGIADVDYEHESLIALINQLYEALGERRGREAVLDFLGEIHARIAAHFALEERIMREAGYDQYEAHKADHERLLDDIRDIMDDYEAGAEIDDVDAELARRLEAWFGVHFRTHDARLHRMLG